MRQKIIYTNSNSESITLYHKPFILQFVEGLGGLTADTQTEKAPYQDGTTYIDTLLNDRVIAIRATISEQTDAQLETRLRKLTRVFSPKLGLGTLRYERNGIIREIKASVMSTPAMPQNRSASGIGFQETLIELLAPDPLFYDPDFVEVQLASFEGGMTVPLTIPFTLGTLGTSVTVDNQGDVSTPLLFTLFGPLENPVLKNNTTGEEVQVNKNIQAGEKLTIFTGFGEKSVELTDTGGVTENAFSFVTPASKFFQLQQGENDLEYTATSGDGDAFVKFFNRYLGV